MAPETTDEAAVAAPAVPVCPLAPPAASIGRPSSAARMAAMWAGVVPQHPPTIRAPASRSRGTIEPNHGGSAA